MDVKESISGRWPRDRRGTSFQPPSAEIEEVGQATRSHPEPPIALQSNTGLLPLSQPNYGLGDKCCGARWLLRDGRAEPGT